MRIYIASGLDNIGNVVALRGRLRTLGHTITYDWSLHGAVMKGPDPTLKHLREVAELETSGVRMADAVIVLWPGGRGTHAELGMAIAWKIPVIFVSPPELVAATPETCAFYHTPNVQHAASIDEALSLLASLQATGARTEARRERNAVVLGDRVQSLAGWIGKVVAVGDDSVTVEADSGTRWEIRGDGVHELRRLAP